jgi:hypothetical protein
MGENGPLLSLFSGEVECCEFLNLRDGIPDQCIAEYLDEHRAAAIAMPQ